MDEKRLLEIIAEYTTYSAEEITLEMEFVDDLGIDSLDLAQILMSLETEFDIELEDEFSEDIRTVGEAVEILRKKLED